jgi:hypothetical protein
VGWYPAPQLPTYAVNAFPPPRVYTVDQEASVLFKSMLSLALFAPLFATDAVPPTAGLTVHELGTFTSVAAADGGPEQWALLTPPTDLPCFVYHLSAQCVKCSPFRVRMETPVIYFYAPRPLMASVHVGLPGGLITEWYPQGARKSNLQNGMTYGSGGNIEWNDIQVSPGAREEFPHAGDSSHYYAARETDSAPLRVGDQAEKVLFYRGVAGFDIPIQPKFMDAGILEIRNIGADAIGFAILFENRGGKTGFRVVRDLRGKLLLDSPELTANVPSVRHELESALTAAGLYSKEAAAMLATWGDSWFEEGMRIFYVMPRRAVDAVLPIQIKPAPATIERVFVGRVEMLSPAMQATLETAMATGDTQTLARFGRFAGPFCNRIMQGSSKIRITQAASDFLGRVGQPAPPNGSPCRVEPSVLPTAQQ